MSYKFQRALDASTDQTLVEPNWEGILECVDLIRGAEVPVKEALKAIQKRYHNPNPHVGHHALLLLEACVKNCGKKFLREVATKEFMDDLKNMVISNPPEKIRDKILELIQCWTSAFKGIAEYKIVEDTHALLKMNGFEFPPIDEAKAMFLADSAPDWAEGDNCYRCRVEFGFLTRKHHCRACGQIFCDKCSNKQMLLPQFGIEKKVRVCEACFDKNQSQSSAKGKSKGESNDKAEAEAEAQEKARKEAEAKEQEELQLALAISQSEAEAKERQKWSNMYAQYNSTFENGNHSTLTTTTLQYPTTTETNNVPQQQIVENNIAPKSTAREEFSLSGMGDDSQEQPFDSMLAKYLDRDYWERKRRETEEEQGRATAPPPSEISLSISSSVSQQQPQMNGIGGDGGAKNEAALPPPSYNMTTQQQGGGGASLGNKMMQQQHPRQQQQQDELASMMYTKMDLAETLGEFDDLEGEEQVAETSGFCRTLKERVDTLNTRMRSNQLRGRSIVNDSAIHSLFSQLTDAHAKVLERMAKLEGQREHFERLQDHLAHIGEARQAVNALREESERQRQEALREEQNRRQSQLRQKLELMRHRKHEMLLNERQSAIQRFQQNERQILHQRMMHQQSPQTVGGVQVPPVSYHQQMMTTPHQEYVVQQQHPQQQQPTHVVTTNYQQQHQQTPPQQQQQQMVPLQQPPMMSTMMSPQQQQYPLYAATTQQQQHNIIPYPQHLHHHQSMPTFPSPMFPAGHQQQNHYPTMMPPAMTTTTTNQPPPPQHQQMVPLQPPAMMSSTMPPQQQQVEQQVVAHVPEDLLISFD